EVATYAKSQGLTLHELLDQIYAEFGYYLEKSNSMTMEGAEGAAQIQRLVQSYASRPPQTLADAAVRSTKNFAEQEFRDIEGDKIPKEKMLVIELEDGRRAAVRPSGTEPKIKFYLFGHRNPPDGGKFSKEELGGIKEEVRASLDALWDAIQRDANERLS